MIELEDNKHKIASLKEKLISIGEALKIADLEEEIKRLEEKTLEPSFWEDQQTSGAVITKMKQAQKKVERFKKLEKELENLEGINELLLIEEDEELGKELLKNTETLEANLEKLELETLLSGKYDKNNALLTLHPGAGGT